MIVGDGPLRPALEARVAAHGAGDWITFAGRLTHAELVAALPARLVGQQRVAGRGMGADHHRGCGCGTPAVATDVSGHRSSVVDGVTGVLTPLDRLGETMADVLLDDDRRSGARCSGTGPRPNADVGRLGARDPRCAARSGHASRARVSGAAVW